ncbi:MAG TPA: hypothetical protein VN229_04275 [Terriglobales bacterium]|nr:hypothetical protein [Terriglobales bacterium]
MKITILVAAMAVPMLLSACSTMTSPQTPKQDNADKLFLRYVDISKRTTLVNADDMTEINHLTALISTRKNACEQGKNAALRPVRDAVNRNYLYGSTAEDLAISNAANRQQLKQIETTSISSCDGHNFPKVGIN